MAVGVLTNIKVDAVNGIFTATLTADGTPAACSIFPGFKPRVVRTTQISGTVGAGAMAVGYEGLTAAYNFRTVANGTNTIETSAGFTFLDGTEATPAAKATNSPAASGPGVTLGTGIQVTASAAYLVEMYR